MAGNMISNNLASNQEMTLSAFFMKLAKMSFQQEQEFYKKLNLIDNKYIPKDVEQCIEILTDSTSFKNYQTAIEDTIYGKGTHFIKYFYDSRFIELLRSHEKGGGTIMNNLEQDIAEYIQATTGTENNTEDSIDIEITSYNFKGQKITILYLVGKEQQNIEVSFDNAIKYFEGHKGEIKSGDFKKYLGNLVRQTKKVRLNKVIENENYNNLLKAINQAILAETAIGAVTKRGKGYFITRGFNFGNKSDYSLAQVLLGDCGRPNILYYNKEDENKSALDFFKNNNCQITYTNLLNSSIPCVAGDIIKAINNSLVESGAMDQIIGDVAEDEASQVVNEATNDLINALMEGMFGSARVNLAAKEAQGTGKRKTLRKNNEAIDFSLGTPTTLKDILENKDMEFQLRGDSSYFKSFLTDKFSTEFEKLLAKGSTGNSVQVQSSGSTIRCGIHIVREDQNLFYNNLNKNGSSNISKEEYSNEGIAYRKNNNNYETKLKQDAEQMANLFGDTIYSVISQLSSLDPSSENDAGDFERWWMLNGENKMTLSLEQLIINNPTQIYEILNKRSIQHVAGMIGETLFGTILVKAMQQSSDSVIHVLGQSAHGTGEAAVDIAITLDKTVSSKGALIENGKINIEQLKILRANSVGFQLKNLTSIGDNRTTLYATTNKKISDEKTMSRYIEADSYKTICDYFFNGKSVFYNGSIEEDRKEPLAEIGNILSYHIPYFMRFDEAQMSQESFGIEQNNFYIVNFHIVPTSGIFGLMSKTAEQYENDIKFSDDYFYFSIYASGEDKDNIRKINEENRKQGTNLIGSYEQFRKNYNSSNNNNLLKYHNDFLALNFRGFSISFATAFDKIQKVTNNAHKK